MYDLATDMGAGDGHGPTRRMFINPAGAASLANYKVIVPNAVGHPNRGFGVLGDLVNATTFDIPFDFQNLADFDGDCTVVRMMGNLALVGYTLGSGDSGEAETRNHVEVRAWMYMGFEQEVDSRTAILHPFNINDFDSRILWSTSWFVTPSELRENSYATNPAAGQLQAWSSAAQPPAPQNTMVNAFTFPQYNKRINIRQRLRFKGNQRLVMTVAAGPILFTGANAPFHCFRFNGCLRALVQH